MKPLKLPWRGRDVPAAMLDVVRGCNCTCRACYNRLPPQVRTLDEISADLDVILRERAVEIVGISGGEPLLHPDILEIIRRVRARGVAPTLLTNGILWTEKMAEQAAGAGLSMVMLHVQEGQRRPERPTALTADDAAQLLREKCALAARHGVEAIPVATVNARRPEEVAVLLRAFRARPDGALIWLTLEREMRTIDAGSETCGLGNGVAEMTALLARFGWLPFAGIGGLLHPEIWRWMTYHGYARLDAAGRETAFAALTPSWLEKTAFALMRLCRRRVPGRMRPSRGVLLARIVANAVSGGPVRNLGFALGAVLRRERIVSRHVIVEAFPDLLSDGRIEFCDPCLDATAKDGRLVPPCIADFK